MHDKNNLIISKSSLCVQFFILKNLSIFSNIILTKIYCNMDIKKIDNTNVEYNLYISFMYNQYKFLLWQSKQSI
jgi:hypothetical protein